MAANDPAPTVADAGPIIHLDELGCLDLLGDFGGILIPQPVMDEVARHRPRLIPENIPSPNFSLVDVAGIPSPRLQALIDSFRLDAGEAAALTLMEYRGGQLLLCDDAAARLAAESLGYSVHGTIGVLIRSIRQGRRSRTQVLEALRQIPQVSTLHVSRQLLTAVIARIEKEAE